MADGDITVDTPNTPPGEGSQPVPPTEPEAPPFYEEQLPPDSFEQHAAPTATIVGSAEPLAVGVGGHTPPVSGAGAAKGPGGRIRVGDRIFGGLASGASGIVILIVLLVAAFLLAKALPSIVHDKANFLFSDQWNVTQGDLHFGVAALLWTTVLISAIALAIAAPIAIGIALFITEYAPARLAKPIAYAIDLLAAIPSIIYGIWGARILSPKLHGVQRALTHLDFIPLFKKGFEDGTVFDGAVVLTVMILPIITAISRDVFARTPIANKEAALAMGATRWEMIRLAVLPYGRAGVVSGAMLGLGRALGETVAVYLILAKVSKFSFSIFSGGETFASKIANNQAEFGNNPGPYIASGLVLFALTFVVNALARFVVNRKKDFA